MKRVLTALFSLILVLSLTLVMVPHAAVAAPPPVPCPLSEDFEGGDIPEGWWVDGLLGNVEVLDYEDFDPDFPAPEAKGDWGALLSNGGEGEGGEGPDLDGNDIDDYDTSTLGFAFEVEPDQVPAALSFQWSFLTDEEEEEPYDDFFMVTLHGENILTGSVPGLDASPFPDTQGVEGEYRVYSPGDTDGSIFEEGATPFQSFSYVIDSPDYYILEFLVADQDDDEGDSGLLIDDVLIETGLTAEFTTILTLEASESQDEEASCPWVFTWNGSRYVGDNDVYSTARGAALEFTDYYTLNRPLLPKDGSYSLQLRELTSETSYTDLVQLMAVDHPSNVKIACDENGNVWTYSNPSPPLSAIDNGGSNVLGQVATEDDSGFSGFNEDYVVLDFGDLTVAESAVLVLRVNGFEDDGEIGDFLGVRPFVFIQTQDGEGEWVTRHSFYPREKWAVSAYNLADYLTGNTMVRLLVASCHTGKYQTIDYVGLDVSGQSPITINTLSPVSAIHSVSGDVLDQVSNSDDDYANMSPSQKMTLTFPVPDMAGEARDFIWVTEGYYIPGTYYVYTWNGSDWVVRGSWAVGAEGDRVHDFDLSLFLPDPDGRYRVRISQSYSWDEAAIDYVGLTRDGAHGTMTRAQDFQKDESVLTELQASDNVRDEFWEDEDDWGNRWVEVEWGFGPVGGELYPVDKLSILAPWLVLALFLALGGGFVVMRRRLAR